MNPNGFLYEDFFLFMDNLTANDSNLDFSLREFVLQKKIAWRLTMAPDLIQKVDTDKTVYVYNKKIKISQPFGGN